MSRVGKRVIVIPKGVEIKLDSAHGKVQVKGPKGTLGFVLPALVQVAVADGKGLVQIIAGHENEKAAHAQHGAAQSILQSMVQGVTTGFQKTLEISGVGYRAEVKGKELKLSLGFSHPVNFPIPEGIQMKVANQTVVTVEGADKALVGQVAANVRGLKEPEPYQGKGIKYQGEQIRRKVGKAAAGATGA